jgi:hypothetical protein
VSRTHVADPVRITALRWRLHPCTWLIARLRAVRLDAELAAGERSWRSGAHAARALQLTTRRTRQSVAAALDLLVERADRGPQLAFSAAVPPCREQVHHARPLILALATRLRSAEPVNAHGVAALKEVLSDGFGPCYRPTRRDALTIALVEVLNSLNVAS